MDEQDVNVEEIFKDAENHLTVLERDGKIVMVSTYENWMDVLDMLLKAYCYARLQAGITDADMAPDRNLH